MEEIVDMTATQSNKAPVKAGLLDRLKSGPVICAEGYLFELERRPAIFQAERFSCRRR